MGIGEEGTHIQSILKGMRLGIFVGKSMDLSPRENAGVLFSHNFQPSSPQIETFVLKPRKCGPDLREHWGGGRGGDRSGVSRELPWSSLHTVSPLFLGLKTLAHVP